MDSIFILVSIDFLSVSSAKKDENMAFLAQGLLFIRIRRYQTKIPGVVVGAKNLKEMRSDFDEELLEDMEGASLDGMKKSKGKYLKDIIFAGLKGISGIFFSSKKVMIITVAGIILFIGLITGGMLFFQKSSENLKGDQDAASGKEVVKTVTPLVKEPVFEDIIVLKPFDRIRLKKGSDMKLISLNLSLELSDRRYKKEVMAMEDKIRQIITGKIEEMTWLELRGPEGKIMLKYDLLKQMNSIFSEVMIRNIYFTNFLMQR